MFRTLTFYFLTVVLALYAINVIIHREPQFQLVSYSEFLNYVEKKQVEEVTIGKNAIEGKLVATAIKEGENEQKRKFRTFAPEHGKLIDILRENQVRINIERPEETPWWMWLVQFLPYLFLVGLVFLIIRQAQSGGTQAFTFGRSRAKMLNENRIKVTFADVAGIEEAKEELQEIVEFLKLPKKFESLGARIPKGVLLLGSPGTGKTLLGRAIAGEAGVPFFYISGSDFVEMFVGVGAARVRDLFEQGKRNAPCIVFIDEIDAVGRQRGAGLGGGHDEREQTLNQLLVEMDGFEPNSRVILLAATNRPDVLDPALLRPGRFDRQVIVDKPDVAGRKAILAIHARNKILHESVDLEILAKRTPGFTGADLENLLNEAALLAARSDKSKIEMSDCEEAIDRVLVGPERKSRIISDKEKRMTAYHEAGHALVARLTPHADPVRKVTILPRGMALGITWQMPEEDKHTVSKEEIIARITTALGGRVAEEVVLTEITTGASDDLEKATSLARRMVCEFGMSAKLGPLTYGRKQRQIFLGRDLMEDRDYSENIANAIDEEVKSIVGSCYDKAKDVIQNNIEKLHRVAQVLLEKEVLEGQEIDRLLKEGNEETKDINSLPTIPTSDIKTDNQPIESSSTASFWDQAQIATRPNLEPGG